MIAERNLCKKTLSVQGNTTLMKANLLSLLILLLLILPTPILSFSQDKQSPEQNKHWENPQFLEKIDADLKKIEASKILPGFAVAVFDKDQVFFQKGYGFADTESQKAYTPQTIQIIASITKSINGMALMKLVDEGKISLDDPVNKYLPFEVSNPRHPDIPITLRHLATHTGSIDDPHSYNKGYVFTQALDQNRWPKPWHKLLSRYDQNAPMDLGPFLKKVVAKDGAWYDKKMYLRKKPGTYYEYSNLGAALNGFIIEQVAEMDYRDYVKEEILSPLGMTASTWYLDSINPEHHTTYYLENYKSCPDYSINTYPDGGLYSSVSDLRKFLQEVLKGHAGEGTLLSKAAYKEMLQIQSPVAEEGIGWDFSFPCCIGHAGNDFGTTTLMFFEPKTGIGRIIFANISTELDDIYNSIYGNMMPLLFQKK